MTDKSKIQRFYDEMSVHSIYGLQRVALDYMHAVLRGGAHRRAAHPYDVWKTRSEVRKQLHRAGFRVTRELAMSYLPGELAYVLFQRLKEWIAAITRLPERLLRRTGLGGYLIGVLGVKAR